MQTEEGARLDRAMHTARYKPHVVELYAEIGHATARMVRDNYSEESQQSHQSTIENYNAAFTAARDDEFDAEGLTLADMRRIYLTRLDSD